MQAALESAVQLEAFPKSIVHIKCIIMESAGGDLAVLITAASLALADAGIPMLDLVTAVAIVSADIRVTGRPYIGMRIWSSPYESARPICKFFLTCSMNIGCCICSRIRVTILWAVAQVLPWLAIGRRCLMALALQGLVLHSYYFPSVRSPSGSLA